MDQWGKKHTYSEAPEIPGWVIGLIVSLLVVLVVGGYFMVQWCVNRHRRRFHVVEEPHIELQVVVVVTSTLTEDLVVVYLTLLQAVSRPPPPDLQSSDRPTCQICRKYGHEAPECWNRLNFAYQGVILLVIFKQCFLLRTFGETPWYMDSGANNHLTSDATNLDASTSYSGHEMVSTTNGEDDHTKCEYRFIILSPLCP
ncbi:hypothetical protein C5167_002038 [Papaver somniferum]|uniref:Uncharacterized protein n=1 Tax=Papaver somniferum TaxID=3469 RepID=A0A4Y7L0A8_PAPSO|nr:hypothetical protein C5167_002038 [Papaver somniferum]